MPSIADAFDAYKNRLHELEHFIGDGLEAEKTSAQLSSKLIDRTKAYCVLCYAESEQFIELCASYWLDKLESALVEAFTEAEKTGKLPRTTAEQLGKTLKVLITDNKDVKQILVRLTNAKPITAKEFGTLARLARSKIKAKRKEISQNNSLNSTELSKLFDRNEFDTEDRFVDLRNDLDRLTQLRGIYAHTGIGHVVAGIRAVPSPSNSKELVMRLIVEIEELMASLSKP